VVNRLAEEYAGVVEFNIYAEIDHDSELQQLAFSHGVNAVPVITLVSPEGVELDRIIGPISEDALRARIDNVR